MAVYQYVVKTPERWDNIAQKAYAIVGSVVLADGTKKNTIEILTDANPEVVITPVIPAGTVLNIPVIQQEQLPITDNDLPPWLQ